jgi:predicted dehydrogenase
MAINVGLIGCGTVAGYGHLPALSVVEGARLVAVADAMGERARAAAEKYGVPAFYSEYGELLARGDIELVVVATPPSQHHRMVLDALAAGKHVFCEKPLATCEADGEEMVRAARAAGRLLAVDFEARVEPLHQRVRAVLDEGALGRPRVLRFINLWMGGRWAGEERYRMLMTDGQGPIVDCGVHAIDLARWLGRAEFAEVRAMGAHVEGYAEPDHVILTGRLASGALVLIEESWVYTHTTPEHAVRRELEVLGDAGLARYSAESGELGVYTSAGTSHEPMGKTEKPFVAMYERVLARVRRGALVEDLASGEDGLAALRVALAALREARLMVASG